MKNHSMIFDDFFEDPIKIKALINSAPMEDIKYADGVTYPNIVRLPLAIENEVTQNLKQIFGPITVEICFARYSFEDVIPPHWAHSDHEIAQYIALVYLSDGDLEAGTYVLKHRDLGFETHPREKIFRDALIEHANDRKKWFPTFLAPAKFNRLVILNTELIHAAGESYGTTREDGRLVLSVFFNIGER